MTGRDFVACAGRLAQNVHEAELRCAVSRAYYGAFHEVLALLRDLGVRVPKTEQVHAKVAYCMQDCGDANAAVVGRELEFLRIQRRLADYELDSKRFTDRRSAQAEVVKAQRVVGLLEGCRLSAEFRAKVRAHAKMLGLTVFE